MLRRAAQKAATTLPCLLFGPLVLSIASKAHAWGDDGHRVVGEIAWRHLTPEAKASVAESLTEPGYETLAEAATWADTFARRQPSLDAMKPFHYVNVDARSTRYQRERDCASGCVVTALAQFVALLESRDPALSPSERRRSIYWTAHLMGDIHQPLHVAHPDGKGGTTIRLRFFDAAEQRTAHWIWDVGLIERRPPPPASLLEHLDREQPSYRALTDELLASLSPQQARAHQRVTDAEALANETLLLARRVAFLKASDHVDAAYEGGAWPIVAQQLRKGGLRLAAVLNRALGPRATPATR